MKTGFIIFGVIFLAMGILSFVLPTQTFSADTGTNNDMQTSTAKINIPISYAYTFSAIGFIFLLLGLVLPSSIKVVQGPRGPRGRVSKKKIPRKRRKKILARGTSVTKTTKTIRR